MTRTTSGSIGSPPKSALQATRTPLKSRCSGSENIVGLSCSEIGERASGPEIEAMNKAISWTVRAIGPTTAKLNQAETLGQFGTRPAEGRNPTTLQKLAGLRRLPPRSGPPASGSIPQASAAAAPPLLPPHVLARS